MAVFVLVHGAWHGGWSWKKVIPLLRAAGHEVYAPSSTGLGERAHLASPQVDLEMHIQDVAGLLEAEDLYGVILVGHSYGGLVITGAADRAPQRIARLVYLDAFVPEDGQSLFDMVSQEDRERFLARAASEGEGWKIPAFPLSRWGVTAEEDMAWMAPRVLPQPLKTFTQKLSLQNPGTRDFKRTYISCTIHRKPHYEVIAARLRHDPAWTYRELAAMHDVMVTLPGQLAGLLLESAL